MPSLYLDILTRPAVLLPAHMIHPSSLSIHTPFLQAASLSAQPDLIQIPLLFAAAAPRTLPHRFRIVCCLSFQPGPHLSCSMVYFLQQQIVIGWEQFSLE